MGREALVLFLRSYRGTRPRFASGTLMSLQEGTRTSNRPQQMTQRKTVFALVPTGNPPSLRFGHPDVTTGDTVLPRLDTSRVPHISSAPSSTWDMSREALVLFLRSYREAGCRIFPPRLRRGTRHPDAPLPPCFAAESVRADTLRALPENAATPATTEQEGTGTSCLRFGCERTIRLCLVP